MEAEAATKLGVGVEGGFQSDADKFDTAVSTHSIVLLGKGYENKPVVLVAAVVAVMSVMPIRTHSARRWATSSSARAWAATAATPSARLTSAVIHALPAGSAGLPPGWTAIVAAQLAAGRSWQNTAEAMQRLILT